MVPAVWFPSGAAISSHNQCVLSQVGTRPDMTLNIVRTQSSNNPTIYVRVCIYIYIYICKYMPIFSCAKYLISRYLYKGCGVLVHAVIPHYLWSGCMPKST